MASKSVLEREGMAGLMRGAAKWFWNPDIWLPPNVTWESFDETRVVKEGSVIEPSDFARFGDLWYPIPLALVVIVVRQLVERFLFKPLGVKLGLKDKARRGPVENLVLEKAFNGREIIDSGRLAKDTGMTVIQVTTCYCCTPVGNSEKEFLRKTDCQRNSWEFLKQYYLSSESTLEAKKKNQQKFQHLN